MLFNSYAFVLAFLPIVVFLYYQIRKVNKPELTMWFLVLVSFVFYCWNEPLNLIFLLVNIFFNYMIYILLKYATKEKRHVHIMRKGILGVGVLVNLGMLLYFKYYNFFIDSSNLFLGTEFSIKKLFVPMGISFITFQQIAFLTDAYRQEVSDCNIAKYTLFISYFPHVSSGPIITHGQFMPLISGIGKEKEDWNNIAVGIYMFVMGLGKKVLFADMFGSAVDWGYANIELLNSTSAVFIMLAYTLQIYFDFSGYSDMAIGISRMLNLDLPINFNSPYKANNILEFWDRWHITLTKFFTKYFYIPLGGSRKGKGRMYINTMVVFLCSGIWHGASWTFVLWGFMHGCSIVITKRFKSVFDRIPASINHMATFIFVNVTWVLFRSNSFGLCRQFFRVIISNKWGDLHEEICTCFNQRLGLEEMGRCPSWLPAFIILGVVLIVVFKAKNVQEKAELVKYNWGTGVWVLIVLLFSILSFSSVTTFVYSYF